MMRGDKPCTLQFSSDLNGSSDSGLCHLEAQLRLRLVPCNWEATGHQLHEPKKDISACCHRLVANLSRYR